MVGPQVAAGQGGVRRAGVSADAGVSIGTSISADIGTGTGIGIGIGIEPARTGAKA